MGSGGVGVDPVVGQRDGVGVGEQDFKTATRFEKTGVFRVFDAVIPFKAVGQGLSADVAGTDEAGAIYLAFVRKMGK